jgi:hypothetical protein
MYGFLLKAAIKPATSYDWFTYRANKPVTVVYRGQDIVVDKGQRFGVRPSSSGKLIRLVFPNSPTRVITIDLKTAKALAKGV